MTRNLIQKYTTLIVLMLLTSCASSPRFTGEQSDGKRYTKKEQANVNSDRYANLNEVLKTEIGLASFYAHDFHGKLTFTEEVYDMYALSAAHPTYPMHTIIRVTNTSNNRQIKIRINDRMPQHPERIIDLSLGTAQELDMVEDGITEVKIEVLKWGE